MVRGVGARRPPGTRSGCRPAGTPAARERSLCAPASSFVTGVIGPPESGIRTMTLSLTRPNSITPLGPQVTPRICGGTSVSTCTLATRGVDLSQLAVGDEGQLPAVSRPYERAGVLGAREGLRRFRVDWPHGQDTPAFGREADEGDRVPVGRQRGAIRRPDPGRMPRSASGWRPAPARASTPTPSVWPPRAAQRAAAAAIHGPRRAGRIGLGWLRRRRARTPGRETGASRRCAEAAAPGSCSASRSGASAAARGVFAGSWFRSGCPVTTCAMTSVAVSPANACRPVSIS